MGQSEKGQVGFAGHAHVFPTLQVHGERDRSASRRIAVRCYMRGYLHRALCVVGTEPDASWKASLWVQIKSCISDRKWSDRKLLWTHFATYKSGSRPKRATDPEEPGLPDPPRRSWCY